MPISTAQIDAFALSESIRQRLVDLALEINFVRDARLRDICERLWRGAPEKGGLVGDIWVEGAFPAEPSGETLASLVSAGVFDAQLAAHLDRQGAVPMARPLYTHQAAAVRAAKLGSQSDIRPGLVVTAGTGAGKTEAFLLPVLNELFASDRQPNAGTRCIILYPMNALVNDQVDRLYQWLQGQDKVTVFHFTSETPEDRAWADIANIPSWDACRMRTRQEARGLENHSGKPIRLSGSGEGRGPVPDIVITNYSMLEYMLCRPQDAPFFGPGLKNVVLDEAHLYTGTLAAEITLLMRRLLERCRLASRDVTFFATSATIGTGQTGELESFASQVFSKPIDSIQVIAGRANRARLAPPEDPAAAPTAGAVTGKAWLTGPTLKLTPAGEAELAEDPALCAALADDLRVLCASNVVEDAMAAAESKPARLLRWAIGSAPVIHQLEGVLWTRKRLRLLELAEVLWGTSTAEAVTATVHLLQMAAAARECVADYPLVPHRVHLVARMPESLGVCVNAECAGPAELRLEPLGCVTADLRDRCAYCGSAVISIARCDNCGETGLAGRLDTVTAALLPASPRSQDNAFFTLEGSGSSVVVNRDDGRVGGIGMPGVVLHDVKHCPNCGAVANGQGGSWAAIRPGDTLAVSVLAETLLAAVPEYPSDRRRWLPARGRRVLAFSDSRREAARFGPRLTRQHEFQVLRAAMAQVLSDTPLADSGLAEIIELENEDLRVKLQKQGLSLTVEKYLRDKLQAGENQLAQVLSGGAIRWWAEKLSDSHILEEIMAADLAGAQTATEWVEEPETAWRGNAARVRGRAMSLLGRELASPSRSRTSLETLGLAEITYPSLEQLDAPDAALLRLPTGDARDRLRAAWADYLAMLCDSLRSDGVVTVGSDQEDQEYSERGVRIGRWSFLGGESSPPWLVPFIGDIASNRSRRNWLTAHLLARLGIVENDLGNQTHVLLSAAFGQLKDAAESHALPWLDSDLRAVDGNPVPCIRIRFPDLGLRRPGTLFRSSRTGLVWPRSVEGLAPHVGCDSLEPVSDEQLDDDPRIGRLRRDVAQAEVFRMALWAEEHSAQLAADENRRLQDLFKLGARNVLSSTTTLELGIDIGGLNAVLMNTIPRSKANYLQRAGRAGRRADGSSVAVAFAHRRAFDKEVFLRFGDYLGAELRRPRVLLDRSRVVTRHLHAWLLSEFFREVYPADVHVGAMAAFGNMGDFCGVQLPPYWQDAHRPHVSAPRTELGNIPLQPWFTPRRVHEPGLEGHFLDFLFWVRDYGEYMYRDAATRLLAETGSSGDLEDWSSMLYAVVEAFAAAVADWRFDYENLLATWYGIAESQSNAKRMANSLRYQLRALHETTVIESLGDRQFLPRYGFPIGLQQLKVIVPDDKDSRRWRVEDQFRLERPGLLALGEYVPGSQLIVGGKVVTSRGILKHWTGANIDSALGLRGKYLTCPNGHLYYSISQDLGDCPLCGLEVVQPPRDLLFVRNGYSTAAWDPPRASVETDSVGEVQRATVTFTQPRRDGAGYAQSASFGGVVGCQRRLNTEHLSPVENCAP